MAPVGSIRFIQRKGRVQYYLRKDPKEISGKYIRKSDLATIRTYLQKRYNEQVLKIIEHEVNCLENYINKSENSISEIQRCYSELPLQTKEYINPIDMSDEDYAKRWQEMPFKAKIKDENRYVFETDNGEIVRSKSELTIANALSKHKIPYKYECPIRLSNGRIVHPDFTVLNTRTRKIYYWEHRGMMDDREYAKNAVKKIKEFTRSGILLGDKLIITEETLESPLGTAEIEAMISHYFL